MKRKFATLGCLLLCTLFLTASGLLEPRNAYAFCDATVSGDDCLLEDDGGTDSGGTGGWVDPCRVLACYNKIICGSPGVYECWCFYSCTSGNTIRRTSGLCPSSAGWLGCY